jgi:hypothetical protein
MYRILPSLDRGALFALPSLAAEEGYTPGYDFTSLFNTDFVVLIGFVLFLSILFYFNVPSMIGGMLDKRADGIKSELDEARALREEAQTLLASYERKQREVAEQSERIVAQARTDAEAAAEAAKAELAVRSSAVLPPPRTRSPAPRPRPFAPSATGRSKLPWPLPVRSSRPRWPPLTPTA